MKDHTKPAAKERRPDAQASPGPAAFAEKSAHRGAYGEGCQGNLGNPGLPRGLETLPPAQRGPLGTWAGLGGVGGCSQRDGHSCPDRMPSGDVRVRLRT